MHASSVLFVPSIASLISIISLELGALAVKLISVGFNGAVDMFFAFPIFKV